jgi:hypothetical protein
MAEYQGLVTAAAAAFKRQVMPLEAASVQQIEIAFASAAHSKADVFLSVLIRFSSATAAL